MTLAPDDLLRVNRGGVDYQATWAEVKAWVPGGPPDDPDAQDYITRVEAADGEPLEDTVKDAINQLVLALKGGTINFWTASLGIWPLIGPRAIDGILQPLKSSTTLVNNNFITPDYSRTNGLTGSGTAWLRGSAQELSMNDFTDDAIVLIDDGNNIPPNANYAQWFNLGQDGNSNAPRVGIFAGPISDGQIQIFGGGNSSKGGGRLSSKLSKFSQGAFAMAATAANNYQTYFICLQDKSEEQLPDNEDPWGAKPWSTQQLRVFFLSNTSENLYSTYTIRSVGLYSFTYSKSLVNELQQIHNDFRDSISAALSP